MISYIKKYYKYKNKYLLMKQQLLGGTLDKKVLILCHPKKVTGTFEPLVLNEHWYGSCKDTETDKTLFELLFEKYNLSGIPKFFTIDNHKKSTADFVDDAFSDDFINKNLNTYDLVMVPDCGGIWYDLQLTELYKITEHEIPNKIKDYTQEEYVKNLCTLISSCLKLTKMLKNNGIIQFGKFITEIQIQIGEIKFDSFILALKFFLERNNFTTEIINIEGIGYNLIAKKNIFV